MLKISHAASPCLSQLILVQFALEIVLQPEIAKKSIKNPILAFKVNGHPRPLNSVAIKSQRTTSY